ncbi:MAG: ROK family protein [Candidatus Cloacimonetes bacterium]|nr:ROK family protein [Candidatus Cloacimonadota bacterium]
MDIFAGLDLGGSSLKYGYGNSVDGLKASYHKSHYNRGREELYSLLSSAIHHIKGKIQESNSLKGIALGTPGFIDHLTGDVVGNCPNLNNWVGANPKTFLEDKFNIPVIVENDADLMAFGESDRENGTQSLLGITVGTGIGSGFVVNQQIYHGAHNSANEVGHTIIEQNGIQCLCGKRGCLEAYGSIPAIEAKAKSMFSKIQSIELILQTSKENREYSSFIKSIYDKLGIAIANAVTIIDPQEIIIGGGLTECPSFSISPLKESIRSFLNEYQRNRVVIKEAKLKNKAGVWGGIVLVEEFIKQ